VNLLPEEDHVWRGGAALLLALAQWTSGDLEAAQQTHADGVASLRKAGDVALATSAAYDAADLAKARGRLSEASRIYQRALQLTLEHGDPALPGIADLHLGLSELHCERNELASATRNLRQSEQPGKHADLRETPYRRCIAWARLRLAQRDLVGAIDLLDDAERLHVPGVVPDIHPIAAQKARVWIAQGRVSEAVDWVRQQGLSADDDLTYMGEFGHITLARILLAQGDDRSVGKVDALLERLLDAAERGRRTGSAIEILVLQALARRLLGDIPAALVPLERALTLAEPEGYVRIFVDEGTAMRDLLRHAVAQGISSAYAEDCWPPSTTGHHSRPFPPRPSSPAWPSHSPPGKPRSCGSLRPVCATRRSPINW
jgi:LuxR family maltose regulon positive regulatory protein